MTIKDVWYNITNMAKKKAIKKSSPIIPLVEKNVNSESINIGLVTITDPDPIRPNVNAQELFNQLMSENNLQIDFDVLEGTIPTQYGIIKLEKPTLVIKATYVINK